jgi:methylphosphotriester-DNA--protein-cysteine methyltransferase
VLDQVRAEILRRPRRAATAVEPVELTEAQRVEQLARVIAGSVAAAEKPVRSIDKRLNLDRSDGRLTAALAMARDRQWVELTPDGFIVGDVRPDDGKPARIEPAARVDRAVAILEAAGRGMSRPDLARQLGVSDRTLARVLAQAQSDRRVHRAADGWRAGETSDVAAEDARKIVAFVRERGSCSRRQMEQLDLGHTRLTAAVRRARESGWIDVQQGRGFIPGDAAPPTEALADAA